MADDEDFAERDSWDWQRDTIVLGTAELAEQLKKRSQEEVCAVLELAGYAPEGKLLPRLTTAEAKQLTADGVATGGMIPKLGTAMDAVAGGVGEAVIMDGRVPHCALEHLFGETDIGTAVCA